MNEEMNRQEAELNEAELTGVSGGAGSDQVAKRKAGDLCGSCCKADNTKATCRSKHWLDFADYILKNGGVRIPSQCPYFND